MNGANLTVVRESVILNQSILKESITHLHRDLFSRISDINCTKFSSEKNKVSDPGVTFSVNYNEIL